MKLRNRTKETQTNKPIVTRKSDATADDIVKKRTCPTKECKAANLEELHETDRGLYAITLSDLKVGEGKRKKHIVKIGYGGGLNSGDCGGICKRINSYHTCFPDGVWILMVLVIKTRRDVNALEKALKDKLVDYHYKTTTRVKGEWYKVSLGDIEKAFNQIYKEHSDKCDVLYNFIGV